MRIGVALILVCCCLSAVIAQWFSPMTGLPDEHRASSGPAAASALPPRARAPFNIRMGTLDTIGGTRYDWQFSGPVWRMLVDSRRCGIYAVWMYSQDFGVEFRDLSMRCNFYDSSAWCHAWNWLDSDFMYSGVLVSWWPAGYGNVDTDTSGVAVVSAHHSTGDDLAPVLGRDAAVGCGIFDYAYGEPIIDGYQWPCVGVSMNGFCQLAMVQCDSDNLYWSRLTDQGWDPAERIASPGYPTHNIATSKVPGSEKVCITWVVSASGSGGQLPGFHRESWDAGDKWGPQVDIGFPPTFHPGSDTVPSFHITSLFPFYDYDDRLNIVANVSPQVGDTTHTTLSEIWHFSPDNAPQWNLIHRAGCDPANMQAPVGYNATYACRPSIGQDDYGDLFVTWEQFDSANVETATNRLRADVWASGSTDGGITWSTALKLTTPGTASCRFPCVCDLLWAGDSLAVLYEVDRCAGFIVMGEGGLTRNPMVVQRVPAGSIIQRGPYYGRLKEPNGGESLYPGGAFTVRWIAAPQTFDHGVLSLSTDGGNTFPTVLVDSIPPGETTFAWDPIPQLSCSLCRVKFEAKDSLGATVFSDVSYRSFKIDSVLGGVSGSRPESGIGVTSAPTIVRGVLFLPQDVTELSGNSDRVPRPVLLDVSGRRALDLHAGANDVRALAPGVYFVREEPQASSSKPQAVRKVVLTE